MVNRTLNLGIKCVQPVNLLSTQMCTTASSTQTHLSALLQMCTKSVQSPIVQQLMHSLFTTFSIYKIPALYTVSTEPTITTILINNKRQEEPNKENS